MPSPARVEALDLALRNRLAESLDYLAGVAGLPSGVIALRDRLTRQAVSPWVFCLYSKLVAELSRQASGEISGLLDDLVLASMLPAEQTVVALRDPGISAEWWAHLEVLFDTDRQRRFRPKAPEVADEVLCRQEIERGMALLRQGASGIYDEVRALLGLIALAAPAGAGSADGFDGASTFFSGAAPCSTPL